MSHIPVRQAVRNLDAYVVTPPDYPVVVNANENPEDLPASVKQQMADAILSCPINRYPDASAAALRARLSDFTGVPADQIICGCGSDEIINMIGESFLEENDVVLSHAPGFSMYDIWTKIAGGRFCWVDDQDDHRPNVDTLLAKGQELGAKIIYLCNPCNPTGYLFSKEEIIKVLDRTDALVVLDEAYIEFSGQTCTELIADYDNLIVMRTFSKAFGLAGIRFGYAMGSPAVIDAMYKVRSPYNLNTLTQIAAATALDHREALLARVPVIVSERKRVEQSLTPYDALTLYPSAANFIYIETDRAADIDAAMRAAGILLKYYPDASALRLSIGTAEENDKILSVFKEVLSDA
ncbi:MAG: histidinol-phosphate transaminase [Eubacteriaceae bacterium]|nr:histidinol-phosphate transaminase [Eubacteriaceae bacterium]